MTYRFPEVKNTIRFSDECGSIHDDSVYGFSCGHQAEAAGFLFAEAPVGLTGVSGSATCNPREFPFMRATPGHFERMFL
jgi:hypothetical protein